MISYVEYNVIGIDLLTLTIACETMTVEIICTPAEFAELRDKVEVAMRRNSHEINLGQNC